MLSIPLLSYVIKKTITPLPVPHLGPAAAATAAIWRQWILHIANALMLVCRHVIVHVLRFMYSHLRTRLSTLCVLQLAAEAVICKVLVVC